METYEKPMRCSYPYFDQPQGRPTSNLSFSSLRWTALAWGCSYKAVTVNEFHVSMVIGPDDKILSQCLGSFGGGATCNHGLSQCLDSFGMFFFFLGGECNLQPGTILDSVGMFGGTTYNHWRHTMGFRMADSEEMIPFCLVGHDRTHWPGPSFSHNWCSFKWFLI